MTLQETNGKHNISDRSEVFAKSCRYLQNTTGDIPPARSDFCSVVATAKDRSSFNIYIYGGYGGSDRTERPSDEVYILSVPSFTWVKAPQGTNEHGRRGHRCVKVLPDQMLVFGGLFIDPTTCVDGGIIQVFNLNTVEFQNTYDPTKWDEYKVPGIVTDLIGGEYVFLHLLTHIY